MTKIVKMLVLSMLAPVWMFAQSKTLENVVDVELKSSVAITNNKQIVGYAIFYKIDKMKKAGLFRLEILDENLKSIGSSEFEGGKDLVLKRALYESGVLMLGFFDENKYDGYKHFVKLYDLKGKEKGIVPYDPERVKSGMFGKAVAENSEAIYDGYNNVEGQGFVVVHQSKAKTGGVDVQFIGVDGKLKWEQSVTADKGDRTDLYLTGVTPNAVIFFQMDRGGIMEKDSDNYMLGLSTTDGKQLYKTPMQKGGTAYEPMLFKAAANGKYKLTSTTSHEDDKFFTAKPIGFSIADFNDVTGEIKTIKDFTYLDDLGAFMDMKNESKSEEGYIKAHDICMMPDGSYVMVGEFFRKTVSAAGSINKILSRGAASASQATVGDMFLLRINSQNKAVAMEKLEKDKERILLPTDFLSVGLTMRLLTYYGGFGYIYTDEALDGKKYTVLASGSFNDEKYGAVAITFDQNKGVSQKRFDLEKSKRETIFITRGKPGTVLVMKYNSKEKTITLNLEKVS
jgi:hypothetical protein